jgi:hypothetical protein
MTEEFINLRLDQYMTQYGQTEAVDLMQRLGKSKLFHENLQIAINAQDIPGAKALKGIIHSCEPKFLLAKKRKIYFSSLFFLKVLCEKYRSEGIETDELKLSKALLGVCEMNDS